MLRHKRGGNTICRICNRMLSDDGKCYRHFPERGSAVKSYQLTNRQVFELEYCYRCGGLLRKDQQRGEKFCINPQCEKWGGDGGAN